MRRSRGVIMFCEELLCLQGWGKIKKDLLLLRVQTMQGMDLQALRSTLADLAETGWISPPILPSFAICKKHRYHQMVEPSANAVHCLYVLSFLKRKYERKQFGICWLAKQAKQASPRGAKESRNPLKSSSRGSSAMSALPGQRRKCGLNLEAVRVGLRRF